MLYVVLLQSLKLEKRIRRQTAAHVGEDVHRLLMMCHQQTLAKFVTVTRAVEDDVEGVAQIAESLQEEKPFN